MIAAAGLEPGAWTVNDPQEFTRMKSLGIKRFYTDCPKEFLRINEQK